MPSPSPAPVSVVVSIAVAVVVGILFALPAGAGLATALHLFGYPVALVVIVRFVPVVRERRLTWFAVHELAMACICAGFVVMGDALPIIPNALWLVIAAWWYSTGGRAASP